MNIQPITNIELLEKLRPISSEIIKRECISDNMIPHDFTEWIILNEENVRKIENVPGIYEVAGNLSKKNKHAVAYIGSTDNLTQRLLTHCLGFRTTSIGTERLSNIRYKIQYAKERSYEIVFRTCKLDLSNAEESEMKLLGKYDYAWNIKNNHKTKRRDIY
jgi:predicted GIY-YIG superfamily endonuclease